MERNIAVYSCDDALLQRIDEKRLARLIASGCVARVHKRCSGRPALQDLLPVDHDQREKRRYQGDQRRPDEGHEAALPTLHHVQFRLAFDDHVPRRLQILQDCGLNPSDLLAQYLDERTSGIPGRRAELQRRHFRLMPGYAAIETYQVLGGCAELCREFHQLRQ